LLVGCMLENDLLIDEWLLFLNMDSFEQQYLNIFIKVFTFISMCSTLQ
jgi:hypothetical protein